MKNKRRVLSMLLALTVLGTSFVMSSTERSDETLERAEKFAQKLFETELGKEEQESKELLGVLGEEVEEPKSGYIHASYLQGLDGEEDYILAQRENGGYAIFEKESMEVIEYSNLSSAPYQGLLVDRYYAGPANYYEKKDGKIKNVRTGETFKGEKLSEIAKDIKNDLKKNREERKEKKSEKGIVARNVMLTADPGPTGSQEKPAGSYIVHSRKYIPDYQFFIGNTHHGDNNDNSCASVATQLLLAYNNWAKDGRIIPENEDPKLTNGEEYFEPLYNRVAYFDKPYSENMRNTSYDETANDNKITFYEKIKQYVNHANEETGNNPTLIELIGVLNSSIKRGIRDFVDDYSDEDCAEQITVDCRWIDDSTHAENIIKQEIDEGRPAIASIWYYTAKDSGYKKEGHCVVAYGYQTIVYEVDGVNQNIDGIIAHFGWKNVGDKTNIWFNSDWLNGYVTMETEHEHGDLTMPFKTVTGETNTHILQCTLCGVTYANAEHTYNGTNAEVLSNNDSKHYTHHLDACSCGYKDIDEHTPDGTPQRISLVDMDFYNQYDSTYHLQNCKDCSGKVLVGHDYYFSKYDPRPITSVDEDRQTKHWGKCDCGREEKISHKFYSYEKEEGNVSYHKSHCKCGFWKYEPHYFKLNRPYCHYCGYSIE